MNQKLLDKESLDSEFWWNIIVYGCAFQKHVFNNDTQEIEVTNIQDPRITQQEVK